MAVPVTARSPWSCFKRLRISSSSLLPHQHQAAFIATSRRCLQDDKPQPSSDQAAPKSDKTDAAPPAPARAKRTALESPPSLPSTDLTAEQKEYVHRRPQMVMRDYLFEMARTRGIDVPADLLPLDPEAAQMPRGVQALHRAPLRRQPTHNIPSCNLQLRSFSARNLETMADFAMRAAYYLNLAAKGPVTLPRITERWTVPRSVFVHKKAQENWERITMRRVIQIVDGHPDVVRLWLAFVRKWQWYGVGMRADVWEHEGVEDWKKTGTTDEDMRMAEDTTRWELFGRRQDLAGAQAVANYADSMGFAGVVKGVPPTPPGSGGAAEQQAS